jgi:hypothetical protein
MIVLGAVLRGIEDWIGREELAEEKASGLRGFREWPPGLPLHDTLSEVFGRLDRQALAEALTRWVQAALPRLSGAPGCRDGKRLGGSREKDGAVPRMERMGGESPGGASPTGGCGQGE